MPVTEESPSGISFFLSIRRRFRDRTYLSDADDSANGRDEEPFFLHNPEKTADHSQNLQKYGRILVKETT
jgi:hypothetical protein